MSTRENARNTDLVYGFKAPCKGDEAEDRVDVKTQLGSRATCTSQHRDQAVYSCNFVEQLFHVASHR